MPFFLTYFFLLLSVSFGMAPMGQFYATTRGADIALGLFQSDLNFTESELSIAFSQNFDPFEKAGWYNGTDTGANISKTITEAGSGFAFGAAANIARGSVATSASRGVVGTSMADDATKWVWGQNKGVMKSIRQMDQRGWTSTQVTEAIQNGKQFPATNLVNKGNPAIRYVHPQTGQSIVQDSITKEIIHFGGPEFKY